MKKLSKKLYTEKKFKSEYLKAKRQIEELIENAGEPERFILPTDSKQIANILNFTLQMIDENYGSYELKLHQLVSLIHLLDQDKEIGFRGELYNISSNILKNTNHYEEWKHFSLAINDQYLM